MMDFSIYTGKEITDGLIRVLERKRFSKKTIDRFLCLVHESQILSEPLFSRNLGKTFSTHKNGNYRYGLGT
jgi:hypothetical protein